MKKGFIIALAYPEEFVDVTESWYNRFLSFIGIAKRNQVCGGHAGMVLINPENGDLHYSDFGRYITPFAKGRVRSDITDPEIAFDIKAQFDPEGRISNLTEILQYIDRHPEKTHGEGVLFAGLFENIDYRKAFDLMHERALTGSIPYGPFTLKGSNCSRYVYSMIWQTSHDKSAKRRLVQRTFPTPMPLDVVMAAPKSLRFALEDNNLVSKNYGQWRTWFYLLRHPNSQLKNEKTWTHPNGTWLEGNGSGSWFSLSPSIEGRFTISRHDGRGNVVFQHEFETDQEFVPNLPYKFVFDSNACFCTVKQGDKRIIFKKARITELKKRTNEFSMVQA